MRSADLARYIDHTLLKPEATADEVTKLCQEAVFYNFFSVCIHPVHVKRVRGLLNETGVKVCSVVGFPLGANTSDIKARETRQALAEGADEIDMVINVGALKDKDYDFVEGDIHAVVNSAGGRIVKVILETCLLEKSEIVEACRIVGSAGAHFVKTSTGFGSGGATPEDVALMKKTVGDDLQVKASGGIRSLNDAEKMIAAGADRLGASAGVAIMKELIEAKE